MVVRKYGQISKPSMKVTRPHQVVVQPREFGFGLLPVKFRIPILFIIILLIQFTQTLVLSFISFIVSIIFLALNLRLKYKIFFTLAIVTTFIWLFIGNTIFSPAQYGGYELFIFRLNSYGVHNGLFAGFRRTAQLIFGFACLTTMDTLELSEVFSTYLKPLGRFFPIKRYVVLAFSLFPRFWNNLEVAKKSLLIRSQLGKSYNLQYNILRWKLRLSAVLNHIFENIPRYTFAGEAHYNNLPSQKAFDIKIGDLSIYYDLNKPPILSKINLSIEEGEFVFVTGPNRTGKSTFLKALGGYIPRITGYCMGSYFVGGEDWLSPDITLKNIFPTARFVSKDPFETIIGITVGQEIMGHTSDCHHAKKCLQIMGLEEKWSKKTLELSGGQQVRLVLASLLASNAKIIILDDPLVQLDDLGKKAFVEAFKLFVDNSNATVIITDPHYEYLEPYITRVIEVSPNEIISSEIKSPDEIISWRGLFQKHFRSWTRKDYHFSKFKKDKLLCYVRNLCVSYDNNQVVRDFNLNIYAGEFVAIMGPNGDGKTTSMLALCGLVKKDKGEIFCQGSVGYSFQNVSLQMLEETVIKELEVSPKLNSWSIDKTKKHVQGELKWLDLDPGTEIDSLHLSDLRFLSISTMSADNSILILDEPTIEVQGDDVLKLLDRINDLLSKGIAVVIITHNTSLAQFASRVVRMEGGTIISDSVDINRS